MKAQAESTTKQMQAITEAIKNIPPVRKNLGRHWRFVRKLIRLLSRQTLSIYENARQTMRMFVQPVVHVQGGGGGGGCFDGQCELIVRVADDNENGKGNAVTTTRRRASDIAVGELVLAFDVELQDWCWSPVCYVERRDRVAASVVVIALCAPSDDAAALDGAVALCCFVCLRLLLCDAFALAE